MIRGVIIGGKQGAHRFERDTLHRGLQVASVATQPDFPFSEGGVRRLPTREFSPGSNQQILRSNNHLHLPRTPDRTLI